MPYRSLQTWKRLQIRYLNLKGQMSITTKKALRKIQNDRNLFLKISSLSIKSLHNSNLTTKVVRCLIVVRSKQLQRPHNKMHWPHNKSHWPHNKSRVINLIKLTTKVVRCKVKSNPLKNLTTFKSLTKIKKSSAQSNLTTLTSDLTTKPHNNSYWPHNKSRRPHNKSRVTLHNLKVMKFSSLLASRILLWRRRCPSKDTLLLFKNMVWKRALPFCCPKPYMHTKKSYPN